MTDREREERDLIDQVNRDAHTDDPYEDACAEAWWYLTAARAAGRPPTFH